MKSNIIITADIHLRDDQPVCRTDDFQKTQREKFQQVMDYVHTKNAYWLDCGDFFHKAKPSLGLVEQTVRLMTSEHAQVHTCCVGNHDLPGHNYDNILNSGMGVLLASNCVSGLFNRCSLNVGGATYHIRSVWYGEDLIEDNEIEETSGDYSILLYHGMVFLNERERIAGIPGITATQLRKKYKNFDYVFCGHNHKFFIAKKEGLPTLVNIGSLTRQTADQMGHVPQICQLTLDGTLKLLPIKHQPDVEVMTREHLEKVERKEQEIENFVLQLKNMRDISLSFTDNVERVLNSIKHDKLAETKLREAME